MDNAALERTPICRSISGANAETTAVSCFLEWNGNRTVALAFKRKILREKRNGMSLKSLQQSKENRKEKGWKLLGFFFSWLHCCGDNFAFRCAFCNDAKFRGGHVRPTCEGVVAFAALPDADGFAFNLHEATLRALVSFFESADDFDVSFADCCAVARA